MNTNLNINWSGLLLESSAARTWPSSWLRARNNRSRSRSLKLTAEPLEGRIALSGTWTPLENLMPAGGVILAVPTGGTQLTTPQLFVPGSTPAADTWIATAKMPKVLSYGPPGDYPEMGPGFLLPNGHFWQIGGNSLTALFSPPSTKNPLGKWMAGPTIPQLLPGKTLTGADSSGAMLPNGKVIFDASPWLSSPAYFFQFNPTGHHGRGAITPIIPPALNSAPGQSLIIEAQSTSMLVLPTGQVLYDLENSPQLWLYTPSGSPDASWKPRITSVSQISGLTYLLTGKQLNGMSEGAAPGDDVSMSTNYPIVRLTTAGGFVYFARTFDWSNTEVQTGNTIVTTQFTLPSGIPHGTYNLQVIASGIASKAFKLKI